MEQGNLSAGAQLFLREDSPVFGFSASAACSLPVALKTGLDGHLADAIFYYDQAPVRGRPFAWALFRPENGELISFSRCEQQDFAPGSEHPVGGSLSLRLPQFLTPTQAADGRRELFALYERLRSFLLSESLSEEQIELRGRYAILFEAYSYIEHRPFYKALAPGFIDWLGLEWPGPPVPADKPESAPEHPQISEHHEGEDSILAQVGELRQLFLQKIETDTHKQSLFDQMHAELQQYKNNLLDALTRPIEEDVIRLIDDIEKSMEAYRTRQFNAENYRRMFSLFEGVKVDLMDVLYRAGIEPYTHEGSSIDISRQKIVATLPAEKKRLDKKIAARHAQGWEKNGKVIRQERVSVYLYQPPEKADKADD
ncbi:MAG: nucleotide exchange factor GrpE [Oscillospiraceae bacterium]|nr:nucleotide exchange factor GrpE [Oscillospiraceae bacterium]